MAVTEFTAHRGEEQAAPRDAGARIGALEEEIRALREEFARLRELIVDRERKGRTLINAYKEVIAEFTDLFESQRNENIKRDESLRFFLSSIEGRLKEDIRIELGAGGAPRPRGRWPFRRAR